MMFLMRRKIWQFSSETKTCLSELFEGQASLSIFEFNIGFNNVPITFLDSVLKMVKRGHNMSKDLEKEDAFWWSVSSLD